VKARKRFGQHFLQDPNTIQRILNAIHPTANDHIVEIGPGHGAITNGLRSSGCRLDVIEIDRDLAAVMQQRFTDINLICADALTIDYSALQSASRFRVVGNLPYNISTPLLFRLYKHSSAIEDMIFMLQEEVVDRICAQPATSAFGRLSVMSQYYCSAEKLFAVPATAFSPEPRVTSAIIRLTPHVERTPVQDIDCLQQVLISAFSARRKTIRNGMKKLLSGDELKRLDIDISLRPDQLSLADYVRCADRLWELNQ
jgi:16S rRNA (adenine1518-N6/adenine1519-N6)-dimethyltransferase